MKKKGLFAIVIAMFSLIATLGYMGGQEDVSYSAAEVSTWDGSTNAVENVDYVLHRETDSENIVKDILKIYTAKGLAYYAASVNNGEVTYNNYTISLENDIDLAGREWTPICKNQTFGKSIYFEGNYHTIYNLKISSSNENYSGLFGYVLGGNINNLCLSGVDISAKGNVGALVGATNSSNGVTINNVKVSEGCKVALSGNSSGYVGGLIGNCYGNADIENSISYAKVSLTSSQNSNTYVGGLVGYFSTNSLKLENCAFAGKMKTSAKYAGGIAGYISATKISDSDKCFISNVYSTGTIVAQETSDVLYIGGLFGYARNSGSKFKIEIENAYNFNNNWTIPESLSSAYVGGLMGYIQLGSFTLNNVYQVGKPFAVDIADIINVATHSNLFYKANGVNITSKNVSILDDDKSKFKYNFAGFDFDNDWKFVNYENVNCGLPVLKTLEYSNLENSQSTMSESGVLAGEGSVTNPYLIKTAGDLAFLSFVFNKTVPTYNEKSYAGKYFVLLNDIDLTGKTWIPIGNNAAFNGVFDGFGHSVKGISSSMQESFDQFGLFGKISGVVIKDKSYNSVIKNLEVKEIMFLTTGKDSAEKDINSGAIAGVATSTCFINCLADQKAIGAGSSNAQIIYGESNLDSNNLTDSQNVGTATGYEIEVLPKGGEFYNSALDKIAGEYKIIVVTSGNSVAFLNNLSDKFYKTTIPTDTNPTDTNTSISSGLYAIWKGHKLTGFKTQVGTQLFGDNGSFVSDNLSDYAVSKVYANWEEKKVNVVVHYNSYECEKDTFGATEKTSTFSEAYNTKLSEIWDSKIATVTRAGFVAEYYYSYHYNVNSKEEIFSQKIESTNNWLNGDDVDIYVKWISDKTVTNALTINFVKSTTLGAGYLEYEDAIKSESVSLKAYNGTEIKGSFSNGVYTFNVPTTYSALVDDYVELSIKLNDGYIAHIVNLVKPKDADFGDLYTTLKADQEGKGFSEESFQFFNLDEDFSFEIMLERRHYQTTVEFDGHFAIAPLYMIDENVTVEILQQGVINPCDEGKTAYLGFDFVNKSLISTRSAVADTTTEGLYKVIERKYVSFDKDNSLFLKFTSNGNITYYKFYIDDSGIYNLDLHNGTNSVDNIAQFEVIEDDAGNTTYKLYYYHGASFVTIFATGDNPNNIGVEYTNHTENIGLEELKTDEKVLKIQGVFENQQKEINSLLATEQNVKITLDYEFVDEEGQIITNCDVKLDGNKALYNTVQTEHGTIAFSFENGKLYKLKNVMMFDGEDEIEPGTAGGQKIKGVEILPSNIKIEYYAALTAGKYTIKIVCEKQEYTLTVKAVSSNNFDGVVSEGIEPVTADFTFNYDATNVEIEVVQNNYYYLFAGWYLKGKDNVNLFFYNGTTESSDKYTHTLSIADMAYVYNNGVVDNGKFVVYAAFSQRVLNVNNIYKAYIAYDAENLGILNDDLLSYSINNNVSSLEIKRKNVNAKAYYTTGLKVFYGENEVYSENNFGTRKETFDIQSILTDHLKDNYVSESVVVFDVCPIFARKNVSILIQSSEGVLDADQHVYDDGQGMERQETTNFTLLFDAFLYDVVDLDNVSGIDNQGNEQNNISMNSKFAARKGYLVNSWKYECNGKIFEVFENNIQISENMFSEDELSVDMTVYRTWTANSCLVTVDANGGLVENLRTFSFTATYLGMEVANNIGYGKTTFARYGYTFDGLYYNDVCVYNASFVIQNGNGVVSQEGKFLLDENITLTAHWAAVKKTIRVLKNGSESGLTTDTTYECYYDSDSALSDVVSDIESKNPERVGFVYGGLRYVETDNVVDTSKAFNSDLREYKVSPDSSEANLTMYVDWEYDDYYTFELTDEFENLKQTTYNGQNQEFSIAEFLFDGNNPLFEVTGYQISYNNSKLTVETEENVSATVSMTFGGAELAQDSVFVVKNSGEYSARLQVSVVDLAQYANKGTIASFEIYVNVAVERADIEITLTEKTKLKNVKLILKEFLPTVDVATLNACTDFDQFKTFIKTKETGLVDKDNEQIYEYVIAKYTLMIEDNDFKKFREFDYDAFVEYKTQNAEKVERIISKMELFAFYDFYTNNESVNIFQTYGDCITFESDATNQIFAQSGKVRDYGFGIIPKNSYTYRVYISSADISELSNFNLNYEDGDAYFDLDTSIYILPQVLRVENSSDMQRTYYKSGSVVNIEWYRDITSQTNVDGIVYYNIGNGIYLNGQLLTSNEGNSEIDTIYNFYDNENYLYFNDVRVMLETENGFVERTSAFKVLPATNEEFTIANIKNVATIKISAKLATKGAYSTVFEDLPTSYGENLLKITGIKYNDEGTIKTLYEEQGLEVGNYNYFEIVTNNANEVSLFTTEAVLSFTVSTDSVVLNQYTKLYKWTGEEVYGVDGTMENDGAHEFVLEDIDFDGDDVGEIDLYAVYTDLVLVNYVYPFPETYNHYSIDSDCLQLNRSTIDNFKLPHERGFEMLSLTYTNPQNQVLSYESLFEGGVFKGVSSSNPHAMINLYSEWQIEDFEYRQNTNLIKKSISRLFVVDNETIVTIGNKNESLYSYSYQWIKGGEVISDRESLVFNDGGKVSDSGVYTLKIIATIHEDFKQMVVEETNELSLNFEIQLIAQKVVSVEFNGENEVSYNASDRKTDWNLIVESIEYDEGLDDYSEETSAQRISYSKEGIARFEITKNSASVLEMKNVGNYKIELILSDENYICEVDVQTIFDYTIKPYEFDVSAVDVNYTRKFNADDPEFKTTINSGLESVEIAFVRQSGEDVGEYEVYFANNQSEICYNYIFKLDNNIAWQNGLANTNVSVGNFEITTANALKVFYQVTEQNPQNIVYTYNQNGFTLSLSDEYVLSIKSNGVTQKNLNLTLFDVEKNEVVSNTQVLNILKYYANDLTVKFFNNQDVIKATESGAYTYKFDCGSEFLKRYYSVEFEKGYQFTIEKVQINISTLQANKVYDGSEYIYFDLNGNVISSTQGYDSYIIGKYDSKHVGQNIKVEFEFGFREGTVNANYQFNANSTLANITKRAVSANVELTDNQFVYGEISTNNFENFIGNISLSKGGVDYTDILEEGYYSVDYSLSSDIKTGAAGLICAGNYEINATYDFADFEIESFDVEQFTVSVLEIEHNLVEGMFRVVVGAANANGPYTEKLKIYTGDELDLVYYSQQSGDLGVGHYNLVLDQTLFVNNSVRVTINAQNNALYVISSDEIVYMSILDESIFTKVYNATAYQISVDVSAKQIVVSNGEDEYTSTFTLKESGKTEEIDYSYISSLSLHYSTEETSFVNAGIYRLDISYSSNRYPNIVLDKNYQFEVLKKTIDESKLEISKAYDGTTNLDIFEFDEKIYSDQVYITARYENGLVGENKQVSLTLGGLDKDNYQIASSTTGEITKAQATVTLAKQEFVYGQLTQTDKLVPVVMCGEEKVSTYQYVINFEIQDASYSDNVWKYLNAGTYNVLMSGTSANYDLVYENSQIEVSRYALNVVFETSGLVTAQYGSEEAMLSTFATNYQTPLFEDVSLTITRESGSMLGYYKALSATCENANYTINYVSDTSDGIYRIVKSNETIYFLLVDESNQIVDTVYAEYNAAEYNKIELVEEEGQYSIKFSSIVESKSARLKAFRYNDVSTEYEDFDGTIENLVATFEFVGDSVRDVGYYTYYATNASSTNYEIRFEKYGENSNKFVITKRNLFFKQAELSKVFDNKAATFEFEDAREVLDGILEGDNFGLSYSFYDSLVVAKYVKNLAHYRVEAALIDDDNQSENYVLNLTTADGDDIYGIIQKAKAVIYINSRAGTYGDEITLTVRYELNVEDLEDYNTSEIVVETSIKNPEYSTSGKLKAGEYEIECNYMFDDFAPTFMVDGTEYETYEGQAKVKIAQKLLNLSAVEGNIVDIFTKTYDETTNCTIERDGQKLLAFDGLLAGDIVTLDNAEYAIAKMGSSITVNFILGGVDKDCYRIEPWLYGVINPIIVEITFNYNVADPTSVERLPIGYQNLTALAYPFLSTSSLTTNSNNQNLAKTANFPSSLYGREGYKFAGWNMVFDGVVDGSAKETFITTLAQECGIEYTLDDGVFKAKVSNNTPTVKFVDGLIGLDTENLFGLYYKKNDNIQIEFVANWGVQTYKISVAVTDKNGNVAPYGKFEIDGVEYTEPVNGREYEYNTSITITTTPYEHCSFIGLYNNRKIVTDSEIPYYIDGDSIVITISSIAKNYDLEIRCNVQNVQVVFDLTDYANSTISNVDFVRAGNVYTLSKDYLNLKNITLADVGLSRVGYTVKSISANEKTVLAEDFATTSLTEFVSGITDETVNFEVEFEPVGVVVNLDYDYNSKVDVISVEYGETYGESIDWIEEPIRTGYDFVGWFDQNNVQVTGQTVVTVLQEHTLTARWTLADFDLSIEAENAKIYVNNVLTEKIETSIKYQSTYSFKVVAEDGYLFDISATYPEGIDVTFEDEETANVVVTMPGYNLSYKFVAKADENTITFDGQRLKKIEVFEIGTTETEIAVSSNSAVVETGKKYKIVVTANEGYDMSDVVETSVSYLTITKSVSEDGILTITVEGIRENVDFVFYTQEGLNKVDLTFDQNDKIDYLFAANRAYTEFENISFNIYTDSTFEMYVIYKDGYKYKDFTSSVGIVAEAQKTLYNDREAYRIVLLNITEGGIRLNTEAKKFTLNIQVVSYDSTGAEVVESANRAFIRMSGVNYDSITLDYLTEVNLRAEIAQSYSFAGWSKNRIDIFDEQLQTSYTITKDERLYAIFSAVKFEVSFGTIDRKVTYAEYNDPEKLRVEYNILEIEEECFYEDEELSQELSHLNIYYGSSKTIFYKNPVGYNIVGFGHFVQDEFVLIGEVDNQTAAPSFTISTTSDYMDVEETTKTIYAVVSAKTMKVDISSNIYFDSALEDNENVGTIKLVSESGDEVNEFGYVDGTRVRYSNFNEVDFRNYAFVACTTDEAYLKIEVEREGYKLFKVAANSDKVSLSVFEETDEYTIYKLSGLVGGQNIEVSVLFKPLLNKIVVDYIVDEDFVDAGALNISVSGNNSYKVFTSGEGKSMIEVSAYTDSKFRVISYINLGYVIDENNLFIDANGIVLNGTINCKQMSIENTGYTYVVEFEVENYLGDNEISIIVIPRKFTVKFVEEEITLVSITNVEFGKEIDLSQENNSNIHIFGEGIGYKNEKLNLVFAKQNYNYQGFFTYENGAGVRYIDAEGNVLRNWNETGYFRNSLTSKYEIATNTKVNEETGEFEISLYMYWSYLKTRITFEFTPTLSSLVTAKDLIKGADYTNSWYYEAAPNYIEISYNTRISISAPEIEGYKFYQFVISQKDANGEELTDVVTYSNDIPWETNELDNIVEVNVKVVYFAKIDVVVEGGKGSFEIEQEYENSQAKALLDQNYVDTTKTFKLSAIADEGYEFVSWYNIETGKRSWAENGVWENAKAEVSSIFILTLKGKQLKMSFKDESGNLYDTTYGQILTAKIESITGTRTETLARNKNGTITILKDSIDVVVGDKVTFNMAITFGFGVVWNVEEIKYSSYTDNKYEFVLDIVGSMSEDDTLRILPQFKNTILSIFVERDFVEEDKGENAVDFDNVNLAGNVVYNNEKTDTIYADRDKDASIKINKNSRYDLYSITLKNGDKTISIDTNLEDGTFVLTREFVEENEIIGVVGLKVLYNRKLWENSEASDSLTGNGEGSAYQINSMEDLVFMMKSVNSGAKNSNGIYYANASYILNCDLNLSEEFWTPIGTYSYAFNGKFNFNGHTISAIYNPYFYDEINYNGLFGVLGKDAEIISNSVSVWYWYLSGGVALALIGTITTIVLVSRKKKRQRDKMSAK